MKFDKWNPVLITVYPRIWIFERKKRNVWKHIQLLKKKVRLFVEQVEWLRATFLRLPAACPAGPIFQIEPPIVARSNRPRCWPKGIKDHCCVWIWVCSPDPTAWSFGYRSEPKHPGILGEHPTISHKQFRSASWICSGFTREHLAGARYQHADQQCQP